jgi:methyl-accepting chemotaxis protein
MKLPIPEKTVVTAQPSMALKSVAIVAWSLVIASVIAGLLYYVGTINQEKRGASRNRQSADLALVPALEIFDNFAATDREESLQEALKIVQSDVLKVDPGHAVGLKTQRLIQDELRSIQSKSIKQKDESINQNEGSIQDLSRELERAQSDIAKLEKDKESMQTNLERAQSETDEAKQEAEEAQQATTAAETAKQEVDTEMVALKEEIEQLKEQVAAFQKRVGVVPPGQPRTVAK